LAIAEVCAFLQSGHKKNHVNYVIIGKQEQGFFLLVRLAIEDWPSQSDIFIHVASLSRTEFFLRLQMAFLGNTFCYYVKGINELPESDKKEWVGFLKRYQGPHTLVIIVPDDSLLNVSSFNSLVLPEKIKTNDLLLLADSIQGQIKKSLVIELMQKSLSLFNKECTFNSAMMIMLYIRIMSSSMIGAFCDQYMPLLFMHESSLFQLAEAFFIKEQSFLKKWYHFFPHYSIQFWISFWLEQLFRATMFCFYKKNNAHDLAKKISFRLPFAIINGGWNKLNIKKLQKLHSILFHFDYRIKNGVSEINIHTILNNAFFEIH
jgi:hypothetical protein